MSIWTGVRGAGGWMSGLVARSGRKQVGRLALTTAGVGAGIVGAGAISDFWKNDPSDAGNADVQSAKQKLDNLEKTMTNYAMDMEVGGYTLRKVIKDLQERLKNGIPTQLQYPSGLGNGADDLQQYYVKYTALNTLGGTNKGLGPAAIIALPIVRAEMSEQISLQWQNETTALDELVGLAKSSSKSLSELFTGEEGLKTIGAALGGGVAGRMVGGKAGGAIGALVGVGLAAAVMQPGAMAAGTLRAMKSGLGGPELQGVSKTISRYAGLALHPYDAMYFSAPARRVFAPRYTLIAETQDDINKIHQIVQTFKYCALPGLTGKGSAFTYPNKFQIEFYRPSPNGPIINDEGTYFPYFPHLMVCDSIDITYGDGDNLTLHEVQKAPIVMTISMMFREVDYFTKQHMTKSNPNDKDTPGASYMTPGDAMASMFVNSNSR